MKRMVMVTAGALLLAGCTTASQEAVLEQSRETCAAYGFVEGTDAFAQCMLLLDQQARANATQQRQAFGAALQQIGNSMQQNRPVTCNTTYTPSGIVGRPPVGSRTTCL